MGRVRARLLTLVVVAIAPQALPAQAETRSFEFAALHPRTEFVSVPVVGVPSQAEVGSAILTDGMKLTYKHLSTRSACHTPRGDFEAADDLMPLGFNADGRYFVPNRVTDRGAAEGLFIPLAPGAQVEAYFQPTKSKDVIAGRKETAPCAENDLGISSFDHVEFGLTGLRRELVFSGVSGTKIRLSYREFQDGTARPAFSQEAEYDLAAGREIGFKGARLRILKADNSGLSYVVLKPLGDN